MKREPDLLRALLLYIEERDDGTGQVVSVELPDWTDIQINEHLFQLHEAILIDGVNASSMNARRFLPTRVTTSGHDYLDTIRDPEIWRKAKDGASSAGGFTIELLGEIAKGFIKTQLKKQTGIEI